MISTKPQSAEEEQWRDLKEACWLGEERATMLERQAEEEREKAGEARRREEAAKKEVKEERRRTDEERKRAYEARRKAEEETSKHLELEAEVRQLGAQFGAWEHA